jgi:hypothetical protein
MSNISGLLISDTFNYVLQSDLSTGIVYRIGGSIPVNPIFSSGLTINSSFRYQDGSESNGYILTSDSNGNASWKPAPSGTTDTTITGGTFDYSSKTLTLYNSDGDDVVITGLTDTYISGGTISGTSVVFSFNDGNNFILTGITPLSLFESYTSNTQNILSEKIQYYYQNTAPTGTIVVGSVWQHSDTGVEYTYNYDGNSYQWVQQTLPVGPQGPQGVNGTNNIDSGTTTTFNGILVGNGVVVSSSTITTLIGYTPENVANKETSALDNSNTKYPTNNVVNTALQSFSDEVDYATMINQRILFNY